MKNKKFVIFLFSAIIIFITYNNLKKEEINYLALGDGLAKGITPFETSGKSYSDYLFTYLNNKTETNKNYKAFTKEDYRITDLINDIENIRIDKKDNITITNVIKKADIITISIGSEELFYKLKQHEATVDKNNKLIIIKYIDEMFEWDKIDEDSNFNHIELMERELDRIMVLEKDRPDYSECRYWHNFEKNTSDWILDWIIICNNTKENKFYVVEYFL